MSWKKITRKTLQVYSRKYCFLFIVFLSIISLMQLLWFHAYTSIYFDKFTSNVDRFWCNLNDFVLLFKFKISLISSKGIIQNCVIEVDHVVHARKEWNYCYRIMIAFLDRSWREKVQSVHKINRKSYKIKNSIFNWPPTIITEREVILTWVWRNPRKTQYSSTLPLMCLYSRCLVTAAPLTAGSVSSIWYL